MNLARLARRQSLSHPVRTMLTVAAVAVAIFMFCFLRSIVTSLDAAVTQSASNRIIVGSAVSLFQSLPTTYMDTIDGVDGVESVSRFTWFGGRYQTEENFFAQFGADPALLLSQYPEIELPEAQKQAWYADRRGAIVGRGLAEKYGFKIGDQVPLIGTIYPRVDGEEWIFTIHGIYTSTKANVDEMTMYFHWAYLDETLEAGGAMGPRGTSVFVVRLEEGWTGEEVASNIDAYYAAGPQVTRTQTEAAFQAGFITMLGNVPTFLGMIGGAVLVAVLFGVVNTMTLAARERIRSMGILKSLGFSSLVPARLYLMEAIGIMSVGGAIGIGIAELTELTFRRIFGTQIPMYEVATDTLVLAGLICVGIGLIAGAVPAWRAARLEPAEALRRGM